MTENILPSIKKLMDFQSIMFGDLHVTEDENRRGHQFNERLKSGEFVNSGIQSVAENLMANIRRSRDHTQLPLAIFNYGRRFQEIYAAFYVEPARTVSELLSDEEIRHFQAQERTWQWILGNENYDSMIGCVTYGNDVAGFAAVPERAPFLEVQKKNQLEAFAASLLIEAWTLFESLSEDLWEAALNTHPRTLGQLNGKAKFTYDDLQQNNFHVSGKLGTLLKKKDVVSFRTLDKISESYRLAFSEQFKPIEDVLKYASLRHAAAVRNLLIHKRGIIDREFIDQATGLPELPAWDPNGPPMLCPLSGPLCARLSDCCRNCAIWLTNAVHAWIIGHPEGSPPPPELGSWAK